MSDRDMFEKRSGTSSEVPLPDNFEEIAKKVLIKDITRIFLTLVWYTVTVYYYFNNILGKYEIKPTDIAAILYLLTLVTLPFWLIKVQKVFFDPKWEGVITQTSIKTVTSFNSSKYRNGIIKKNILLLIIRKNSGIIVKVGIPGNQFIKKEFYKPGDKVRHYHGVKCLYNTSMKKHSDDKYAPKDEIPCLWCGCFNFKDENRCYDCKTKLAK